MYCQPNLMVLFSGCCPDRSTKAQGPDFEGCGCETYPNGCCPGIIIACYGDYFCNFGMDCNLGMVAMVVFILA